MSKQLRGGATVCLTRADDTYDDSLIPVLNGESAPFCVVKQAGD